MLLKKNYIKYLKLNRSKKLSVCFQNNFNGSNCLYFMLFSPHFCDKVFNFTCFKFPLYVVIELILIYYLQSFIVLVIDLFFSNTFL